MPTAVQKLLDPAGIETATTRAPGANEAAPGRNAERIGTLFQVASEFDASFKIT